MSVSGSLSSVSRIGDIFGLDSGMPSSKASWVRMMPRVYCYNSANTSSVCALNSRAPVRLLSILCPSAINNPAQRRQTSNKARGFDYPRIPSREPITFDFRFVCKLGPAPELAEGFKTASKASILEMFRHGTLQSDADYRNTRPTILFDLTKPNHHHFDPVDHDSSRLRAVPPRDSSLDNTINNPETRLPVFCGFDRGGSKGFTPSLRVPRIP